MKKQSNGKAADPPALIALRRSAKAALELARRTGTPCHVMKDGKIIDIAKAKPKPQPAKTAKQKPTQPKPAKTAAPKISQPKPAQSKLSRLKPAKNGRPSKRK